METFQSLQPFKPYLLADEHLLWSGQPRQGLIFSGRDVFLVPFSLLWGGFAIFWNAMVWLAPFEAQAGSNTLWFFKLWGLPFLFVGLYMIAGRFIHDAHIRKTLVYAVTDQRILTVRGAKMTSLDIHRLPRLELSEYRDGTGNLSFEAGGMLGFGKMNGFGAWVPALGSASQFFRIQNPRYVYGIIRDQGRSRHRDLQN